MVGEYRNDGIIVPPPPKLGSAALYTASTVAVASMTKDENLTTSVVTDRRCLALARYIISVLFICTVHSLTALQSVKLVIRCRR